MDRRDLLKKSLAAAAMGISSGRAAEGQGEADPRSLESPAAYSWILCQASHV